MRGEKRRIMSNFSARSTQIQHKSDFVQFAIYKKKPRNHVVSRFFLVENSGIEPLTSWLPVKRSPSWANPPGQFVLNLFRSLGTIASISGHPLFVNTFFIFFKKLFSPTQRWKNRGLKGWQSGERLIGVSGGWQRLPHFLSSLSYGKDNEW